MAKMAYLVAIGCVTAMMITDLRAQAIPASAASAASGPVFQLISVLPSDLPKVIDGSRVIPTDWPAIVSADLSEPSSGGSGVSDRCSGTLVGPGVVLTASHCFDPGTSYSPFRSSAWIKVSNKQPVRLECTLPDAYKESNAFYIQPRVPQDYALCSFKVQPGDHLPPAEVVDITSVQHGDKVLITGWGCRTMVLSGNVWGVANSRDVELALTIADAEIETSPTDATLEHGFDTVLANLAKPGKHPAVCPGDSGGPLMSGASVANPTDRRRVRAVNSRYDEDEHSNSLLRSSFAALSTVEFKLFVDQWLANNPGLRICGIAGFDSSSAPAGTCRK